MILVLVVFSILQTVSTVRTIECNSMKCDFASRSNTPTDYSYCTLGCMNEICNFDSPITTDISLQKESSVCISECLDFSLCRLELLGDGKCDDGIYYSECNSHKCGWDWGDCGYCAPGCFKDDIENAVTCKPECNNVDCTLHAELCVRFIQGGYCSPGCYKPDLENQICDEACYNNQCIYDNFQEDCLHCQPWMIDNQLCNFVCLYPEYNYDNGECNCSQGCTLDKQSNDVCDWECYVRDCNYDNFAVCPVLYNYNICALGCRTDIIYESCNPDCLSWNCDYNDNDKCDLKEKNYSFYSQMILEDFTLEMLGDGVCNDSCNTQSCAYDFGDCVKTCEIGCNKCYEENGALKCLECEKEYYQLYSYCVSECTRGFIPSVKLNRKVCGPPQDDTSFDNPKIIYVSQDSSLDPSLQTGDFEYPFNSFTRALSLTINKYIRIYLMNFDGKYHILESIDFNNSPLDFYGIKFWENIEITPLHCSDSVTEYCYLAGGKATIRWKGLDVIKNMDIRDIEFDGFNNITHQDCTNSEVYCTYCPNIRQDQLTSVITDDKRQEVIWKYATQSECDRYKYSTFFNIVSATLSLTRVNFVNWRAGFFSLITINKGSLILNEVDFINIKANNQPYSAIITSYQCDNNHYQCSSFEYNHGNVKLLNNGYEYNDASYFSGFFYGKGMDITSFRYINFEQNLAYKGKSVLYQNSDNTGSLIYLENFLQFKLELSSFQYNIVDQICSLNILIDSENKSLYDYLLSFREEHIVIANNTFSNMYGDMLKMDFYTVLPNITLINNIFESIVFDEYLIDITLAVYDPELYEPGTGIPDSGFQGDDGKFKRIFILDVNSFQNCYGPGSIFHIQNLVNFIIKSLSITHSLQNHEFDLKTEIIQEIVYKYLNNENNYIYKPFKSDQLNHSQVHYGNACYFYRVVGFSADYLNLSDNYSSLGGTDALFINTEASFKVKRIDIFNNIANSKKSGTGLSFSKTYIKLELDNVTAMNNTNYLGYGTL